MSKRIFTFLFCCFVVITSAAVVSCEKNSRSDDSKIVIGVSPVPHEEIIRALKSDFEAEGIDVEIRVFDDYVQPNLALSSGDLDANFFQHTPYLESFCQERNLKLVSIGAVHIEPIAFYSKKIQSIGELKEGDEILIPNDATNGGRALLLLQKAGLITLKDQTDIHATEADIIENKLKLKFTALDAANIANVYGDVAGGVINTNFALSAGLSPKDAIVREDKDSPYANIVAVRAGEEGKEKFIKLMKVLHSDKCKDFIIKTYNSAIYPAF